MTQNKLNPSLAELVESRQLNPDAADEVDIILSLSGPAGEAVLEALSQAGLKVNSVIGEIVTGSVPVEQLQALAALDSVVKVEGGGQLSPETSITD